MRRENRERRRGFTLIEIMAVVVIIGLLMAIVGPRVIGAVSSNRIKTTRLQLQTLGSALTDYNLDNGRFPTGEQGLQALVEKPTGSPEPYAWRPGGYVDQLPKDAWGFEFHYAWPSEHGRDFDLWSFGRDGKAGGEGEDADITNWPTEASEQ
jgi:general secretion pathway protein G